MSESEIASLRREFHEMRDDVRAEVTSLRGDMQEVISAWKAAKGIVKFVRIIGSIGAGVATLWALAKFGLGLRK